MPSPPDARITLLLPAYNAQATLALCLRSIVRQRETRWRCLVVDDGSQDDTAAIAQAAAAQDHRFQVLRLPHRGLVESLNAGLEECGTPFVARMDADDVMHRERLAVQLDVLDRNPQLAAVACHVRLFPRHGLTDGRRSYESWLNSIDAAERVRLDRFIECPVVHPTLMFRRDVLQELGYRDQGWPEDYDLILRLHAAGHRIDVVARRLLLWRDHPGRLSRTAAACDLPQIMACRAHYLANDFLAQADTYILWGYGATGRTLRVELLRHGKRPTHIVEVNQRQIGNTIHGAPVVGVDALPSLRGRKLIASVAGANPRQLIRAALAEQGFEEGVDFVCAA